MALQLNSTRNVFGPSEISDLATAYNSALATITEDHDLCSSLTAREIRGQLACAIIAEAKAGQLNPERLKRAALNSFTRPYAELDQLA
jgi:hypothetical protein